MADRKDVVWQNASTVAHYLEGDRAAVPLAVEQIDVMLRLLGASGRPVRRFLDLGCGDGILSRAIADRFPDSSGVLIDFSPPMIEAARRKCAGRPFEILQRDFGDPSWSEGLDSFDAVVSAYAIHHQPDSGKKAVYRAVYEMLAPGGMFVNLEHVSSPSAWLESVHDELFVERLCTLHPERTAEDVARAYYSRDDKAANILSPVEEQCEWLREIGFADVDCYLKIFELAVFGGRKD